MNLGVVEAGANRSGPDLSEGLFYDVLKVIARAASL